MKKKHDGPTRREILGMLGIGLPVALADMQAPAPPSNVRILHGTGLNPTAPVTTAKNLLTLQDLTFKGAWGFPQTGIANNDFGYAYGPVALRYVNGQRRILMATWGHSPKTSQGWDVHDLYELATPTTYSAPATDAGIGSTLTLTGRQWAAAAWQNVGVSETASGIQIGSAWWDEAQQVLWYTTFAYYWDGPCAVLNAVRLNDNGTCERFGPWHYGDPLSNDWKRVCQWLTPIPDAYRSSLQGRTHMMGGSIMSIGGQAHWGLGLLAINLPPLKPAMSGTAQAYNTAPGSRFFIETNQDLSRVPLDGTAVFFFGEPNKAATTWSRYTVPTAITRISAALWQIDGTSSNSIVVGQHAPRVDWAVTYVMPDRGVPLADFSPAHSGLPWPDYFEHRPADYYNAQARFDLTKDPYFGGRTGQYIGVSSELPRAVPSARSIQLAATATAAVGDFIGWSLTTTGPLLLQVRKIVAWDNATKTATVDAEWDVTPPLTVPCDVRRRGSITPADWNDVSAAIPNPTNGQGHWQSGLDAVLSCLWVERQGKHAIVMFGRQAYGGTWYHYWDTYASFGVVDYARDASYFNSSYGYHSEHMRSKLFLYDPQQLIEAANGVRPPNANGIDYIDGGDWLKACPGLPTWRQSAVFPGYSNIHHDSAGGGCQMGLLDPLTNELILILPEQASSMLPIAIVFGLA